MKYAARLLTLLILVSAGLFYASCDGGGGDEKSQEELQLDKLIGTWTIQSVVNDGVDRTVDYPNMTVTIAGTFSEGGTYNYISDADSWPDLSPWKANDNWKFKSGNVGTIIVRQADLQDINYQLLNSDKTLNLSFDYPDTAPGFHNSRTESVAGNWIFIFTRP
jgi:hypothetical protein